MKLVRARWVEADQHDQGIWAVDWEEGRMLLVVDRSGRVRTVLPRDAALWSEVSTRGLPRVRGSTNRKRRR